MNNRGMKKSNMKITAAIEPQEVVLGTVTAQLVQQDGRKVGLLEVEGIIGGENNEAVAFNKRVSELIAGGAQELRVRVNSPGGDLFVGLAMHDTLRGAREKGLTVTAVVMGLAASAATVLLMGAERIEMTENSQLMVHEPATWLYGKVSELRADLKDLEDAWQNMVRIYVERTGADAETFAAEHSKDKWYTAEQAVAAGLADAIVNPIEPAEPAETEPAEPEQEPAQRKAFVEQVAELAAKAGQYVFRKRSATAETAEQKLAEKSAECEKLAAELRGLRSMLAAAKAERAEACAEAEVARAEAAKAEAEAMKKVEAMVAARVAGMGLPADVELPCPQDPQGLTVLAEKKGESVELESDSTVRAWLEAKQHGRVMLYAASSAAACKQVQSILGK